MKNQLWTKTVLDGYMYINRIIPTIDKQVMALSLTSYNVQEGGGDATFRLMEDVIELIERKRKLLRLKLAVEEALRSIPKDYACVLVRRYIDKVSLKEIAKEKDKTYGVMRRIYREALSECYSKLCELGYNTSELQKEYGDENWLVGIYSQKLAKSASAKSAPEKISANVCQKSNSSFPLCFSI